MIKQKKVEKSLPAKTKSVKVKAVAKSVPRRSSAVVSAKVQTAEGWKRMMKKSKANK